MRRKYKVQKITAELNSKYFKAEEAKETLNGKYDPNAPIKQRTHTYKTGSIYTGCWKGGMR